MRKLRVARLIFLPLAALGVGACAALLGIEDRIRDDEPAESGPPIEAGAVDAPGDVTDDGARADADADAGVDADADAPALVYFCSGLPVSTCAGCAAGAAVCPTTKACVSDCLEECDASTLGCFTCAGGLPTGTCEPASTAASCIANPAYVHCACATLPDTCPGANQVCLTNECRTCGEPGTEGEVCRDGTGMMKCKPSTDPDPDKRLRCK